MSEIPGHTSPPYSEDSRDDALFHYTTADGLIGIFQSEEIWGTAYYCSNDASELTAGHQTHQQRIAEVVRLEVALAVGRRKDFNVAAGDRRIADIDARPDDVDVDKALAEEPGTVINGVDLDVTGGHIHNRCLGIEHRAVIAGCGPSSGCSS